MTTKNNCEFIFKPCAYNLQHILWIGLFFGLPLSKGIASVALMGIIIFTAVWLAARFKPAIYLIWQYKGVSVLILLPFAYLLGMVHTENIKRGFDFLYIINALLAVPIAVIAYRKQLFKHLSTYIWSFLLSLWVSCLGVLLLNFIASYDGLAVISKVTKVVAVPLIIIYFFSKRKFMANIFFTIFLLMFFGDIFSVFNVNEFVSKLSKTAYLGSYLLLVFVVIGKLRKVKFEGLISWYLILIFALNTYFMYVLFKVVQDNFTDSVNMVLYVSRGITILVMGFLAFAVYLSKENAQSILFLVMSFCFIFSDVLFYISDLAT